MIDPNDVIKFDRTRAELEEWWLFSTIVAGKTASTQARLLDGFLKANDRDHLEARPFAIIERLLRFGMLEDAMRTARLGQYSRLTLCWEESLHVDLARASVKRLEEIHGIGPKTARMFVMHSRPDQRVAAIDTHVLKFLRAQGHDVPKATPPAGESYRRLERLFLGHADKARMTPADFDLQVWRSYANKEAA